MFSGIFLTWFPCGRGFAVLALVGLLLMSAAPTVAQEDSSASGPVVGAGPFNLTIFHTNDFHSHFLPREATWRDDGRLVGGTIPMAWHLARERSQAKASLLLDAGDFMTGNPVCRLAEDGVQGAAIARMMNMLGYDAGVIGNHEFDLGRAQLQQLVPLFDHPLLAADILDRKGNPAFAEEPLIIERGGLKVGILGVSCSKLTEVVMPGRLDGLVSRPQAPLILDQATRLDPLTDLIVLLTHNGVEEDRLLAKEITGSGVDVIVGGHSHTRLREPELVAGILIVQAGSAFTNLGRLDLMVAEDRVVRYRGRLVTLWADEAEAGPELTGLVAGYQREVLGAYGVEIGYLESDWKKQRGEHNLGDWLCDQIRERAAADVAFLNNGGIRKGLAAGPITALDIHEMLPFSNTLVTVTLTGTQLAAVVQNNADASVTRDHGIMQVSGLAYSFRENPDGAGALVEEILVGGLPLAADRTYEVAMPDYVANMKDIYLGIDLPPYRETGVELADAILAAVRKAGRIDSAVEGRIRSLD